MANTEKSYADRLARGNSLKDAVSAFAPAFAPTDPNIGPDAFASYLSGIEAANDALNDAETAWRLKADARREAAAGIADVSLRVKDHVGANKVWEPCLATVTKAVNAVRGYAPSSGKSNVAPAAADAPPPKPAPKGSKTQTGYSDLAKNFDKVIKAVSKISGYTAAANSGLTLAALSAQLDAFRTLNANVSDLEVDLEMAQITRSDYYDGENGLKDKMKAIKKAVRSQYGTSSPQWQAVKGIEV
jgi:copper chaperone CopZ